MYDEYLAVPGVLSEIIKGDREEHADAFIIACFGDPGLLAAKEVTEKPVIGIAQAAFTVAKMIAPNFSVVYVLDRSEQVVRGVTSPARRGAILQILPQHWSWRPRF